MPMLRTAVVNNSIVSKPVVVRKQTECVIRTAEKKKMTQSNASARSSSASNGIEFKCKVFMRISKCEGEQKWVYFKQDGERFESQETLKLQSSEMYTVKLEVSPSLELLFVKMAGVDYSFELINDPENDTKSIYQFTWLTAGIEPSLNRHRTDVPCILRFKNYKEFEFKLQVKFYSLKDTQHVTWGQQLNSIVLECTAGRGSYISCVDSFRLT